jgi:hypothetical protein
MRTGNELRTLIVWYRIPKLPQQSQCRGDKARLGDLYWRKLSARA